MAAGMSWRLIRTQAPAKSPASRRSRPWPVSFSLFFQSRVSDRMGASGICLRMASKPPRLGGRTWSKPESAIGLMKRVPSGKMTTLASSKNAFLAQSVTADRSSWPFLSRETKPQLVSRPAQPKGVLARPCLMIQRR